MEQQKQIESIAQELVRLLGIEAEITVSSEQQEGEELFHVEINAGDESGLLIGSHGATLQAIQSFIGMAMKQKSGEWLRILVDIGNWRQKHEDYLVGLAKQAAERARQSGEAQHLYNLTPVQRRVIHMALSQEEGIVTESQGEGDSRYLVVKSA